MRVLLIESSPGVGEEAAAALSHAGHEVLGCYESGSAFPCKGVDAAGCPLDEGVVDAALLVRNTAGSAPTPHESGVRCALRRTVPLALAGDGDLGLYQEHSTVSTPGLSEVVSSVQLAVRLGLMPIADAARGALIRVLASHGLETDQADATVKRCDSTLTITLQPGVPLDTHLAETASVRALAAVRGLDPQATIIDVAVESPAAAPA